MISKWSCEWCGMTGEYEHDKHAGVWEVHQEIKDQHYQANPQCVFDPNAVRIRVEDK